MFKLVLLRHGQSLYNLENRFTGWADVDLTNDEEAHAAACLLKICGYTFDVAYTSVLKRAIRTLDVVLGDLQLMWLPIHKHWRLNERFYGALQGFNKAETTARFGREQVLGWRRSYREAPPPLTPDDERYPGHDPRYSELTPAELPMTESLADTVARVLPYWHAAILPEIQAGRRVLIVSHGTSLRALVKSLDCISDEAITHVNIPTGIPLVYELGKDLQPLRSYYLGDVEGAKEAAEAVAHQAQSGFSSKYFQELISALHS